MNTNYSRPWKLHPPSCPVSDFCVSLPPCLCFDSWVLLAAILQCFWPIWKTLFFYFSSSNVAMTNTSWCFYWHVDVMGGVISGHPRGSSGRHPWNPLLSTNSLGASVFPPGPSKVQGLNQAIGALGHAAQIFLPQFCSDSRGEQTCPYSRGLSGNSFASRRIFGNFQGRLWLSELWRLCCWHWVGAKRPTVQKAGPPTRNSLAPDVSSAKVGKHHQKAGLPFPDPWNSGELSFFFFLHAGNVAFFISLVPSWHFPVQVPSARTSVALRIPP